MRDESWIFKGEKTGEVLYAIDVEEDKSLIYIVEKKERRMGMGIVGMWEWGWGARGDLSEIFGFFGRVVGELRGLRGRTHSRQKPRTRRANMM